MTYRNGALWHANEHDETSASVQKLQALVSVLVRAKHRQFIAEFLLAGLFWGLSIACAWVLMMRLGIIDVISLSLSLLVFCFIGVALLISATLAWLHRPDDMQIVILADVQLKLKQKLSTAWEFMRSETYTALGERLAVQAVRARLPARPERIFPLRLNIWGKLSPIVAILLLLLTVIDLQPALKSAPERVDALVAEQGRQLRDYGRRMEAQAQREGLPRSSGKAQEMQRLGSRMESGALSRERALHRLRQLSTALDEQRREALSEGAKIKFDPRQIETAELQAGFTNAGLFSTLQNLVQGLIDADDVQLSDNDLQTLSRLGISQRELEQALQRLEAGDDQDLRRIAEALARSDQALRDSETLADAQQKIQQVRENLGDQTGLAESQNYAEQPWFGAGEEDSLSGLGDSGQELFDKEGDGSGSLPGAGGGYNRQGSDKQPAPFEQQSTATGIVLKPESQMGKGAVYTSEVRTMPRVGETRLDTLALDAKFSAQIEQALAKEEYPLHHKEFIRRYFLSLSDGVLREKAEIDYD